MSDERKPQQPQVEEKIVANVWFHSMKFEKAGDFKMGHKHNFDHAHFVGRGAVDVYALEYIDGKQGTERKFIGTFVEGESFLVARDVSHTVIAKEDNTIASCVQAVRDDETDEIVSVFDCSSEDWNPPEKIKL